jgi:hypothetical protein
LGDDNENKALENGKRTPDKDDKKNWIAVANPDGVVREVKEKKVMSREETDEVKEMEEIQHLGDISDEVSELCPNVCLL